MKRFGLIPRGATLKEIRGFLWKAWNWLTRNIIPYRIYYYRFSRAHK